MMDRPPPSAGPSGSIGMRSVTKPLTQHFKEDHRLIRHGLRTLRRFHFDLVHERPLDLDGLRSLLDAMAVFVEDCHYAKEEALLFPLLEADNQLQGLQEEHGASQLAMTTLLLESHPGPLSRHRIDRLRSLIGTYLRL